MGYHKHFHTRGKRKKPKEKRKKIERESISSKGQRLAAAKEIGWRGSKMSRRGKGGRYNRRLRRRIRRRLKRR